MRIITGSARGTKLKTLEGEKTRPTSEVVKEALFSMIQFEIEGRNVLDLFAGSGQLGLEALSRGARKATLIDNNPDAAAIIKDNAKKTKLFDKCVVLCSDAERMLRSFSKSEKFDIVFIDPPYAMKAIDKMLELIVRFDLLAENGLIICEDDADKVYSYETLSVRRHSRYGRIYITLLEKRGDLSED